MIVLFSRYPNLLDLLLEKLEECATILEKPLIRTDIRSSMKAAQSVPFLYPIAILFTHLLPSSLEFIPMELSSKVTRFAPLLIRYYKTVILHMHTCTYLQNTTNKYILVQMSRTLQFIPIQIDYMRINILIKSSILCRLIKIYAVCNGKKLYFYASRSAFFCFGLSFQLMHE